VWRPWRDGRVPGHPRERAGLIVELREEVIYTSGAEATSSWIRLNRLKDSYTWNVQVVADSNSVEDLRSAKERALEIETELRADLCRPKEEPEREEVAF
jgi:hypothetical protein